MQRLYGGPPLNSGAADGGQDWEAPVWGPAPDSLSWLRPVCTPLSGVSERTVPGQNSSGPRMCTAGWQVYKATASKKERHPLDCKCLYYETESEGSRRGRRGSSLSIRTSGCIGSHPRQLQLRQSCQHGGRNRSRHCKLGTNTPRRASKPRTRGRIGGRRALGPTRTCSAAATAQVCSGRHGQPQVCVGAAVTEAGVSSIDETLITVPL